MIFTRRVYSAYILTRTPSPFSAGSSWGLLSRKIFLFFSRYNSILFFFKLSTFRLAVIFYLCVILVWFPVEFNYLVYITISGFDYNFGFCVFRFYISTRFYSLNFTRINFDLFQHCRFYALTLQLFISLTLLLVINKHLCLCEFVLCLFLAILRLSDVFSFVLGVVYRLGIK